MPLPSNWRNFCQFDGKFVKVTWNWLIFCTFSVKISLQLCQFSKQCRNTIARSFLRKHWYCQSLGSHFVIPRGFAPWDEKMTPLGLAISMHPSKWSCNNIMLELKFSFLSMLEPARCSIFSYSMQHYYIQNSSNQKSITTFAIMNTTQYFKTSRAPRPNKAWWRLKSVTTWPFLVPVSTFSIRTMPQKLSKCEDKAANFSICYYSYFTWNQILVNSNSQRS